LLGKVTVRLGKPAATQRGVIQADVSADRQKGGNFIVACRR